MYGQNSSSGISTSSVTEIDTSPAEWLRIFRVWKSQLLSMFELLDFKWKLSLAMFNQSFSILETGYICTDTDES